MTALLVLGPGPLVLTTPPAAPLVLVPEAGAPADADFEAEADDEEDVDVPAAGDDDFGLLAFFVGLVCTAPPRCAQSALDGDAVGLAGLLVFALAVGVVVAVAVVVPVGVDFGELEVDALAVPVDGLTGGLLAALDEAAGLVAGGLMVAAGVLVFGDVRGDEVGEADVAAGQDGAATAAWLGVAAAAALVVVPVVAELAVSPSAPWLDPLLPLVLLWPVKTEELSWTTACRSGGTAIATPIANTAQATASAGRSMRSCTSRLLHQPARARRDRARDLPGRASPGPDRSTRPAGPGPLGLDGPRSRPRSWPSMPPPGDEPGNVVPCPAPGPGKEPGNGPGSGPGAGIAAAFAPANVGPPARILARIRSRPSGRGST